MAEEHDTTLIDIFCLRQHVFCMAALPGRTSKAVIIMAIKWGLCLREKFGKLLNGIFKSRASRAENLVNSLFSITPWPPGIFI